jgi:hypothetical protein
MRQFIAGVKTVYRGAKTTYRTTTQFIAASKQLSAGY